MNLADILTRIDAQLAATGLSDRAVSLRAGSPDIIRNWRRAIAEGKEVSPRLNTVTAIAAAIGLDPEFLIHGAEGTSRATSPPPTAGLQEAAAPFAIKQHPTDPNAPDALLRQIFGPKARTPSSVRLLIDLPAFALMAGDIVVLDLARLPVPGELALVSLHNADTDQHVSGVYRYFPPYLLPGTSGASPEPLRVDQPEISIRHPVIGSIRGL